MTTLMLGERFRRSVVKETTLTQSGKERNVAELDQAGSVIEGLTISVCLMHYGPNYVHYLYSIFTFSNSKLNSSISYLIMYQIQEDSFSIQQCEWYEDEQKGQTECLK